MPCGKGGERKHTPIVSAKQARFFGAEYGRAKSGESRETSISKKDLKSHLKEWGGKKNPVISPVVFGNEFLQKTFYKKVK